jgi:hypothetical protein
MVLRLMPSSANRQTGNQTLCAIFYAFAWIREFHFATCVWEPETVYSFQENGFLIEED